MSAPWRMKYLNKASAPPGCVFCHKLSLENDVDNLILWRGETIAILMNLFPYSTGHIMLMPYQHVASPELLEDPAVMTEIALELPKAMRSMRRVLDCQGFNTGMNTGSAAGAGIADHMHLHVVPRWNGDANFMPVTGNVTVMPELLSVTYAKLRAELMVEHDASARIHALVLSKDFDTALVLPQDNGGFPAFSANSRGSVVNEMNAKFVGLGIEASIAGWLGEDTIIWLATAHAARDRDDWVPIARLPESMASRARPAISWLQQRVS